MEGSSQTALIVSQFLCLRRLGTSRAINFATASDVTEAQFLHEAAVDVPLKRLPELRLGGAFQNG